MNRKTKADVQALGIQIKTELGIDLSKYRSEEIEDRLADILVFPKYFFTSIIKSVIFFSAVFLLSFFVIKPSFVFYVLYGVFGLLLFLFIGILAGLLSFTSKIKSDLNCIFKYLIDTAKNSINDIKQATRSTLIKKNSDLFQLIFEGLIYIVILPILENIIMKKMPVFKKLINNLIIRVFTKIAEKVHFEIKDSSKLSEDSIISDKLSENFDQSIYNVQKNVDEIFSKTLRTVQFPIKFILTIISLITIVFVYLLS